MTTTGTQVTRFSDVQMTREKRLKGHLMTWLECVGICSNEGRAENPFARGIIFPASIGFP
jgi:hypothetical protein